VRWDEPTIKVITMRRRALRRAKTVSALGELGLASGLWLTAVAALLSGLGLVPLWALSAAGFWLLAALVFCTLGWVFRKVL
jgi:hypothetical protein